MNQFLTDEIKDEFYSLLQIDKVERWAQSLEDGIISEARDFNCCPIAEYLLSTGVYASVEINCNDRATFTTEREIEALFGWKLENLNELESLDEEEIEEDCLDLTHCLDLPGWVSKAIDVLDDILKHRPITGFDVVNVINQVSDLAV